ncbi:hypothetical protein CLV63_112123 [Murinocardiopsis flavida]|uniref:Uncharacterized protein n=1 Tax=Murinocardiopsis flavida TaxID=645275 RepID=A0A2P8DG99_9ACTN|nr:hypothetical protein [Murinocardiopsis flavida]PSK96241.1 hypothetical protein CLV63_112123 [Murinocardiopsis flavida]
MGDGIDIERQVRDGLLAVGLGTHIEGPTRFWINSSGYHLTTAGETRGLNAFTEWAAGHRTTVLHAERVWDGPSTAAADRLLVSSGAP